MTNIYQQRGFENRKEYLKALTEALSDYTSSESEAHTYVSITSCMLGPEEDFDGLLSLLADQVGCSFIDLEVDDS